MAQQARQRESRPSDPVLVYNSTKGRIGIAYNKPGKKDEDGKPKPGQVVDQGRVGFNPGLTLCPAPAWSLVQAEPGWDGLVAELSLKPIAGHSEGLTKDWSNIPSGRVVEMVRETGDVPTLIHLDGLEKNIDKPRATVAEAIDARMASMQDLIRAHMERKPGANRR